MKKIIFLALIAIATVSACAQMPKGFEGIAIDIETLSDDVSDEDLRGRLLKGSSTMYVYTYDVTTMGVIESLDKLMEVLEANDRLDLPDNDTSEYPSYYTSDKDGNVDYELIARFCRARSGEISKCWYINDDWGIIWQIDDTYAQVITIKWDDE